MKVFLPVEYFKYAGYIPKEEDQKSRFNEDPVQIPITSGKTKS